jgi:hypothetical protein
MKNKQRALVLAVLFITAIFIVNSYADPGTAKTKTIVGFAGVPTTEFSKAKELGATTVQVNSLSASELQSALETAKSLGLGLVGRAESFRDVFDAALEKYNETAKTSCGNGICEPGENRSICPADCKEFKNVFNGLHSGNGVEHSLKLTDGGVWETFAFKASDDGYASEEKWREAIER